MRVEDEAGKIDLNRARGELLRRLFMAVGVEPPAAQALVDKILDWREAGIGRRLNGAKAEDYRAAGFAYGPREGPFASVEELRLAMDMTPALFARVAPSLTVYSQSAWIDPAFAPPDVLAALAGLGAAPASQILGARRRRHSPADDRPCLHDLGGDRRRGRAARSQDRDRAADRLAEDAARGLPMGLRRIG
jgi:general secretion pathway protein K